MNDLARAAESPWQDYSILVVDDEPGMASFLLRALTPRCGAVHAAASVEEARPLLGRHRYDLIVLDIALPDMSGFDVAEQVPPEIAVVLVSSRSHDQVGARARSCGARGFIPKDALTGAALEALLGEPA